MSDTTTANPYGPDEPARASEIDTFGPAANTDSVHGLHSIESPPSDPASGLREAAYRRWRDAQTRTAWGATHLSKVALTDGSVMVASAARCLVSGFLDGQPIRICALTNLTSSAPDRPWLRTLVAAASFLRFALNSASISNTP
jgi:hypothetical protein